MPDERWKWNLPGPVEAEGRRDTLWQGKTLVMGMQFLRIAFLPPDGYNLKSLKSPKRVKERGNSTWYPKGAAHPHVKTRAKEGRKKERWRVLPADRCSVRRPPFTSAKFISSKNEHFRGYVIQADDSSNRIFVSSVYTGRRPRTYFVSNRDRIATFSKGPHTFHMESRRVVLHDMYMSHDIFSRESARSRKRKLFHMKRKDPLLVSRKKIHLSNK